MKALVQLADLVKEIHSKLNPESKTKGTFELYREEFNSICCVGGKDLRQLNDKPSSFTGKRFLVTLHPECGLQFYTVEEVLEDTNEKLVFNGTVEFKDSIYYYVTQDKVNYIKGYLAAYENYKRGIVL